VWYHTLLLVAVQTGLRLSELISFEEWFNDLFGARGNIAVASGTMLGAITSIIVRFNAINEGLSAKR
jgi:hypothetical protein